MGERVVAPVWEIMPSFIDLTDISEHHLGYTMCSREHGPRPRPFLLLVTQVGLVNKFMEVGMEGHDFGIHAYSNLAEIVDKRCWHRERERERNPIQRKVCAEYCTLFSQICIN